MFRIVSVTRAIHNFKIFCTDPYFLLVHGINIKYMNIIININYEFEYGTFKLLSLKYIVIVHR